MDRERADHARRYPDEDRVPADPYGPIAAARREYVDRVVVQIRTRGRAPRVCLYALSVDGQVPRASLDSAAAYAQRQSWQVLSERSYADPVDATDLKDRPGWLSVREQVRKGFVDGVVVVTADVVSRHLDEYRAELAWFEVHFGFVALVVPETFKRQS